MRQRKTIVRMLLAGIFLLLVYVVTSSMSVSAAGGSGTIADPFLIENVDELQNMTLNVSAHYKLINDIDASATSGWNSGAGFVPIGNASNTFNGSLEGAKYNITSLFINRSASDYQGLFGYTGATANIVNVTLLDVNVSGNSFVGGFTGRNNGSISNSYCTGSTTGAFCVGGFVGNNYLNPKGEFHCH